MKEKNFLHDIKNKSLKELTELANKTVENLENQNDLQKSINDYQNLIKLNNLIQKKFYNSSKEISSFTRKKISEIIKKNEKKNR